MSDDMKPNLVDFLVEKLPGDRVVLALPMPGNKETWLNPKVEKELKEAYQDEGVSVLASNGRALVAKNHNAESVRADFNAAAKSFGAIRTE